MKAPLFICSIWSSFALVGCSVTQSLAPGAEAVIVTRLSTDVAKCSALGNINLASMGMVMPYAEAMNQAIGLGGDTVLDTTADSYHRIGNAKVLATGVIYRCAVGNPR